MSSELFALCIPFRDLAGAVDEWREQACTSKPSHGVPPHVTLLVPAPADVEAAAVALEPFAAFDVTFTRFGRFPGALWLAPEPSEPFVAMTEALVSAFPDYPPYGGEFEGITPHLTVAQGEDLDDAETELALPLPLSSRASSVVLFEQLGPDSWRENAELLL